MEKQPCDRAVSGAEEIQSSSEQAPHLHPNSDAPPKEGIVAWLQVVGAFCVYLNTW